MSMCNFLEIWYTAFKFQTLDKLLHQEGMQGSFCHPNPSSDLMTFHAFTPVSIHSPIHPFIHSSINPSIHLFIHPPTHHFIQASIHSSSIHPSIIHSSIHFPIYSSIQSPINLLIHSFTESPLHLTIYPLMCLFISHLLIHLLFIYLLI